MCIHPQYVCLAEAAIGVAALTIVTFPCCTCNGESGVKRTYLRNSMQYFFTEVPFYLCVIHFL